MDRIIPRLAVLGLLALVVATVASAVAATNNVPQSRAGQASRGITANDLKPRECAGVNVTNIDTGSGTITGTNQNDLILGTSGTDTVSGEPLTGLIVASSDCIAGGGGNDTLHGDSTGSLLIGGDDVILGGPGDDSIDGAAGNDVCYGGDGNDTFTNCETRVQ